MAVKRDEEGLAIVKSLMKRHPKWKAKVDKCERCGLWCFSDMGYGKRHPACQPIQKRKSKAIDPNQGQLTM